MTGKEEDASYSAPAKDSGLVLLRHRLRRPSKEPTMTASGERKRSGSTALPSNAFMSTGLCLPRRRTGKIATNPVGVVAALFDNLPHLIDMIATSDLALILQLSAERPAIAQATSTGMLRDIILLIQSADVTYTICIELLRRELALQGIQIVEG